MGSATSASTVLFQRERLWASHQAIGVPTTKSTRTVIHANRNVTHRALKSSSLNPPPSSLFQIIAVPLNNVLCLSTVHELHQGLRGGVTPPVGQEEGVLTDGIMKRGRDIPSTALALQLGIHHLGQRKKPKLRVSRIDKTDGLSE